MFYMSTANHTFVGFQERLKELIAELSEGNAKMFAENAGIQSATFYNYLKGRVPPADAIANICSTYGISLNWLVLGIGPKFMTKQGEPPALDPDPEIASLMEGARRVLTSGNPIAFDALERNIRYFDHAIAAEKRADVMEKKIEAIQAELTRLKRENLRLDKEAEEQSSRKKVG